MSGGSLGGLGDMLNGGGGMQTFDPVGSLGTNAINSLFGTNFLGQGGMSNNWATHVGNGPLGANLFNAGNPTVDAQNAANAAANPGGISQLPINIPQGASPNSWAMPTPQGGFWNQIAQQMAGPIYTGGLQIPGVSPEAPMQPTPQPPMQPTPQPIGQSVSPQSMGKGGILQSLGNQEPPPIQPMQNGISGIGGRIIPRGLIHAF